MSTVATLVSNSATSESEIADEFIAELESWEWTEFSIPEDFVESLSVAWAFATEAAFVPSQIMLSDWDLRDTFFTYTNAHQIDHEIAEAYFCQQIFKLKVEHDLFVNSDVRDRLRTVAA